METEEANEALDDDVRVEESKSSMEFAIEKEVFIYYKKYAKQADFGGRTQ